MRPVVIKSIIQNEWEVHIVMKPFLKFGLIAGGVGFMVIIPLAALVGICGPVVPLLAGMTAGFLTAYLGKTNTQKEGAQQGALAGVVSGVITTLGQMIGGILALYYIQTSGASVAFGQVPDASSPAYQMVVFYATGLLTGMCFGIVGIILGAAAGAIAGYLGTRSQPAPAAPTSF